MKISKNGLIFVGGINTPRLKNGKTYSRNYHEKDRLYNADGICNTITSYCETKQGWYLIKTKGE